MFYKHISSEIRCQYGVASLCISSSQSVQAINLKLLHKCYKHTEDVHMTFGRQVNYF